MSEYSRFTNGFLSSALAAAVSMAGAALPANDAEAANNEKPRSGILTTGKCRPQPVMQAAKTQTGVRCLTPLYDSSNPNMPAIIAAGASNKDAVAILIGNPSEKSVQKLMDASQGLRDRGMRLAAVVIGGDNKEVNNGQPTIQIYYKGAITRFPNMIIDDKVSVQNVFNKIKIEYDGTLKAEMAKADPNP